MRAVRPPGAAAMPAVAALMLTGCMGEHVARSAAPPPAVDDRPEGYTGSTACRPCHPETFDVWERSLHGRHMAPPSPDVVVGDFEKDNTYEIAGTRSQMAHETLPGGGHKYTMTYRDADGQSTTHTIDWALGQARHQVYLTRMEDGRLQVLPTYWNTEEGHWRDATEGAIDAQPPVPRTSKDHWTNHSRTFNLSCLECHGSQGRKNYDRATNRYDSQFDPAINCESCHGAGGEHVDRWTRLEGRVRADRDDGLPHLGGLGWAAAVEVCSSCHAKKKVYATGYTPRASFYDFFMPDVWEADGYFVDGRSSNLNYRYVDFMQNRCSPNAHGRLDCGSCHPPHDLDSARGKTVDQRNAMCTRCHLNIGNALTEHTGHKRTSAGSACIDCHMPAMPLGLRMTVRDHSIGSPLPELTRLYGIPNACAGCHTDRDQATLEADVLKTYGERPTFQAYRARLLERTTTLADAFGGAAPSDQTVSTLIRWLGDTARSVVERASAAQLLARAAARPDVTEALLTAARDPHPVVRFYALQSVAQAVTGPDRRVLPALEAGLKDPQRAVRIRAFESLEIIDKAWHTDARPEVARAREEARVRREVLRDDDPGLKAERALMLFYQGRAAEAEALLRRLVTIAPRIPGYRADLAQYLVASERFDEAARVSEDVLRLDPGNLGATLAMAEIHLRRGRPAETLRLLDTLAPDVRGAAPVQSLRAAAAARVPAAP
jgi:tetratricopeptide (TPR) repeat protein